MGYSADEIERYLQEYLSRFHTTYKISKNDKQEIEKWCQDNLGKEFLRWNLYKSHSKDSCYVLSIMDSKKCTVFELKFSESILEIVDRPCA